MRLERRCRVYSQRSHLDGGMLRLSKLTDYGVVVLVRLAASTAVQTTPAIAHATGIPEPTVAKVLKMLAGAALVTSQRGAHGGYRLARALASITVVEVITAIEGPIALAACVVGSGLGCEVSERCALRGRWDPVNSAIREALGAITLADMQAPRVTRAFHAGAVGAGAASLSVHHSPTLAG